jgi:catechol 2,3-dioxygenase-like lactoylglutathione lyase family enzyme
MRLRQVAFAARDLEAGVEDVRAILGLEVAHRDPQVAVFGLVNAVFPVGEDFLEIVSPAEPGTAVGRHIARTGGDSGYMLIVHCRDARAEQERIAGFGIQPVWRFESEAYSTWHYHPRDCGGFLLSIDGTGDARAWPPAGTDWRPHIRRERVAKLAGVELAAPDPARLADTWSKLLARPLFRVGDVSSLALENLALRFVRSEAAVPSISALAFEAPDPEAVRAAAGQRSRIDAHGQVRLFGVRIDLV